MIEYLPFNEELNRLTLEVQGGTADRFRVTWGEAANEFIAEQQAVEVRLVKSALHSLPVFEQLLPEEAEDLQEIAGKLVAKDKAARDASAAAVVPVKHRLKIEAVQ